MANLGRFTISPKNDGSWTNVTELAGIGDKYICQVISGSICVCEKSSEPSANEGYNLGIGEFFEGDNSATLWAKPLTYKETVLNIGQ